MEKEIIKTIKYFAYFSYAPSLEEIYRFLSLRTTRKDLKESLKKMIDERQCNNNSGLYTLGEYSNFFKKKTVRTSISMCKIQKINLYIKILSIFPQIKLVGLSGTLAMLNAKSNDDIDIFIITSKNRLWVARFVAIICAHFLGLRRKRDQKKAKDKVCLNLFFDESNLKIPDFKRNLYVAHEVLQVRPLINKSYTYEHFLKANKWVFDIFPNAIDKLKVKDQRSKIYPKNKKFVNLNIFNIIECLLKGLQLNIIKQHQTTEIVTDTQLWFFPDDFEKKIKV